jgi:hypothetical protein
MGAAAPALDEYLIGSDAETATLVRGLGDAGMLVLTA